VLANQAKGITQRFNPKSRLRQTQPPFQNPNLEEFWALKDVSFEVKRGDRIGIIGRNGAGKSTLLKILSRITEPTEGRISIKGRVASLLEVGTGFHPELTGRENIYLNGAILGMSRVDIKRKFDEIVAFAEVERFLDTPVKRYSSGMYVRLAFAVAAHLEPEILIVDEVLAVGDAQFQKKCLGKMENVSKEGRTILFVSHNIAAIQALCNQIIYLKSGQIKSFGQVKRNISLYLSEYRNLANQTSIYPFNVDEFLKIIDFQFIPNPIKSGTGTKFLIKFAATQKLSIIELAILFYSDLGTRIALIDLRKEVSSLTLNSNQVLTIKGNIKNVPFVEGEYRIGLYLVTSEFSGNILDLVNLAVISPHFLQENIPYPSQYRGYLEISTDCISTELI
jgi:lipopolysaccharide transport system ATP-binding protein